MELFADSLSPKIDFIINNPAIELKIYPGGDHGIRIHHKPAFLLKPSFPKGYLDSLADFIKMP